MNSLPRTVIARSPLPSGAAFWLRLLSEVVNDVPVNEKEALNGPWWVTSVPIRSQSGAARRAIGARPGLQVIRERRARREGDRLRRGEPQEVAGVPQVDLGAEEDVIIRIERKGCVEVDVELYFLARHRALAAGELIGERIDAVDDRVECVEARIEHRGREGELAERTVRRGEIVIRRRVARASTRPSGGLAESTGNT